jgi:hypothetical protein
VTPGSARLDRIEASLDRLSANAERQDRSIEHLFEISRQRDHDIDRLVEIAKQHNETFERIANTLETLAESDADQDARIADHDARIAEQESSIQEARKLYEEELRRGAEVHRNLEEKLNALIQVVDETVRKKPRNGDQSIQ